MNSYTIYTSISSITRCFACFECMFAYFKFISQIMRVKEDIEALRINETSKKGPKTTNTNKQWQVPWSRKSPGRSNEAKQMARGAEVTTVGPWWAPRTMADATAVVLGHGKPLSLDCSVFLYGCWDSTCFRHYKLQFP